MDTLNALSYRIVDVKSNSEDRAAHRRHGSPNDTVSGRWAKTPNEQFKRNRDRFPADFAFQLTRGEFDSLMSQIAISNAGRGGCRTLPWVFTEHSVAMLSSVLRSKRAVQVNISIVRTFVRLREILATHHDLARKVEEHDRQIGALLNAVQKLLAPPDPPKKHPIGYIHPKD